MTLVLPVTYCVQCDCPHTGRTCPRCGYDVVAEMDALLADENEPATCMEEIERWRDWQTENLRRLA